MMAKMRCNFYLFNFDVNLGQHIKINLVVAPLMRGLLTSTLTGTAAA